MDFIIHQKLDSAAKLYELYGINAAWPLHGQICEPDYLHLAPLSGLVEVVDPENSRRHMRTTSPILGKKRSVVVYQQGGWITPYAVVETLESVSTFWMEITAVLTDTRHDLPKDSVSSVFLRLDSRW